MRFLLMFGISNAIIASCLAVCVFVVTRNWRQPAIAYALWCIVLLKFLTPPIPLFRVEIAQDYIGSFVSPTAASTTARETKGRTIALDDWQLSIGTAWALGSVSWFVLVLARARRFHRLVHRAKNASQPIQREVQQLCSKLGIRTVPTVKTVDAYISPVVWAYARRPLILVPGRLLEHLTRHERMTLLLHELGHLRRHDHYMRILELVVAGVYWWNPAVWLARKKMEFACELCCDALVVRTFPDFTREYGTALVKAVDFLSEETRHPTTPGASEFGPAINLTRRIEMITQQPSISLRRRTRFAIAILAALVLPPFAQIVHAENGEGKDSSKIARPDSDRSVALGFRDPRDPSDMRPVGPLEEALLSIEERLKRHKQRSARFNMGKSERQWVAAELRKQGRHENADFVERELHSEAIAIQLKGQALELELERKRRLEATSALEQVLKEMTALRADIARLTKLVAEK